MVFPPRHEQLSQQLQQQRQRHLQQQRDEQYQHDTREDHTPPHSGHLPPIEPHSPMSSVWQDPQRSPAATATTTSGGGGFLHAPMAISRPNSFYNASNILNAAGENAASTEKGGEDYTDIDMSAYYRPPPPAVPATQSGFYDFDIGAGADSSNIRNAPAATASFANGVSFSSSTGPAPAPAIATATEAGMNVLARPTGVASPPPIPRATRPVSVVPPRNNSSNNNGVPPLPASTYTPPPLPVLSTTGPSSYPGAGAGVSSRRSPISPTSPSNGPLVGGRTPRSIHGSGRRV
ncbi:MAG: hypothetical protein J3R72DRAFT_463938 [Linnemannia gamsii]|nr:MAG: hypothetical protein J3R72DRAFT_463938 [Linnemannia gamsii]